MLLSSLADTLGESKVSALDLAGNTLEFNELVKTNIQDKFKELGLTLTNLFIENMTVPEEVEKAIDERSKLGVLGDKTDVMMKISAAEAMRDAAKNEGMGGAFMGAGVGIGAGAGMGGLFADAFKSAQQPAQQAPAAPAAGKPVPSAAPRFPPARNSARNADRSRRQSGSARNAARRSPARRNSARSAAAVWAESPADKSAGIAA